MEAFFVGAIASSIASTILYPLILAKKRLQSGAGTKDDATLWDVLAEAWAGTFDPHHAGGTVSVEKNAIPTIEVTEATPAPDMISPLPSARRSKSSRRVSGVSSPTPGFETLYQGLQMQILKGFLNQGVTFLVKGRIEQLVVAAYLARKRAGK